MQALDRKTLFPCMVVFLTYQRIWPCQAVLKSSGSMNTSLSQGKDGVDSFMRLSIADTDRRLLIIETYDSRFAFHYSARESKLPSRSRVFGTKHERITLVRA